MTHSSDEFIPYSLPRLDASVMRERAEAFRDRMAMRRSVRSFSAEPVPREAVETCIHAAGQAPSGANQQPWTFVLVGDPQLKQRIREAAEEEERISYAGRMSAEWLAALKPLGTDWQKPHLTDAPFLIVVFAQAHGTTVDAVGQTQPVKHYYVQESVGIAVGVLLAALHHAGLATLTHTPSPMKFLREVLQRPENERAYMVIPVGYPAADAQVPAITRKPLHEILVRDLPETNNEPRA